MFSTLPINSIAVTRDDRQRKEISVDDLLPSIKARGLFHPVIVERSTFKLIAGERRLEACKQLGMEEIPVKFLEDLSPVELQLIELEENIKRKDLTWQEIVRAVATIHDLYKLEDKNWTHEQTADAVGLSRGTVTMYLLVYEELATSERVKNSSTVREAFNFLKRKEQREAGEELQQLIEVFDGVLPANPPAASSLLSQSPQSHAAATATPRPVILNIDFKEWIAAYDGPKFNLLHCDFPYGINLFGGKQGRGDEVDNPYEDDSIDIYLSLLNCLCDNSEKIISLSAHIMFWCSFQHYQITKEIFAQKLPSVTWIPHPLIWHKTDNSGISADARRRPRHIYETALLGYRGDRNLVRVAADTYGCPSDRTLHPSNKPEPMLRHFFSMLVDETTTLLDPTCGAGSALRAADSLGAKSVLGLELDTNFASVAQKAFDNAKMLRRITG